MLINMPIWNFGVKKMKNGTKKKSTEPVRKQTLKYGKLEKCS